MGVFSGGGLEGESSCVKPFPAIRLFILNDINDDKYVILRCLFVQLRAILVVLSIIKLERSYDEPIDQNCAINVITRSIYLG